MLFRPSGAEPPRARAGGPSAEPYAAVAEQERGRPHRASGGRSPGRPERRPDSHREPPSRTQGTHNEAGSPGEKGPWRTGDRPEDCTPGAGAKDSRAGRRHRPEPRGREPEGVVLPYVRATVGSESGSTEGRVPAPRVQGEGPAAVRGISHRYRTGGALIFNGSESCSGRCVSCCSPGSRSTGGAVSSLARFFARSSAFAVSCSVTSSA